MQAVRERLEVDERPACRWLGVNRKLLHYRSQRDDEPLRLRLIALASEHRRYGVTPAGVGHPISERGCGRSWSGARRDSPVVEGPELGRPIGTRDRKRRAKSLTLRTRLNCAGMAATRASRHASLEEAAFGGIARQREGGAEVLACGRCAATA